MKTVIEMAREAGAIHIHKSPKEFAVVGNEAIERFAELVRADERKKVRAAMKKAHVRLLKNAIAAERNSWPSEMEAMERQVNILTDALAKARADEREKLGDAVELLRTIHMGNESARSQDIIRAAIHVLQRNAPEELAAAIRARSNT